MNDFFVHDNNAYNYEKIAEKQEDDIEDCRLLTLKVKRNFNHFKIVEQFHHNERVHDKENRKMKGYPPNKNWVQ